MPPVPKPPTARKGRSRNLILAITAAAVVAAALIGASLAFRGGSSPTPATVVSTRARSTASPKTALVLGNPRRGDAHGVIDDVVPGCKDYVLTTFPTITKDYVSTGKVKIDLRARVRRPVVRQGRNLVLAAALQNKGWQLLELLYHNQGDEKSAGSQTRTPGSSPRAFPVSTSSGCSGTRQGQR